MSCQASLRIAGKAKCYYVYVQHSKTGALTSLKVRLKQYLSITYAYPEPMLKTESNGGTITRKQLMTLENWECFTEHPVLGDRFSNNRQCAETLQRKPKLKI